jgi:hypothetical protein
MFVVQKAFNFEKLRSRMQKSMLVHVMGRGAYRGKEWEGVRGGGARGF